MSKKNQIKPTIIWRKTIPKKIKTTLPNQKIQEIIQVILEDLEFDPKEFSILFTNNLEIQKLNAEFRNKNKATDVLSFEGDEEYLGDIIISVEKAKSQAKVFNCSLREEITRLIIHGFLHLSGYDHVKVPKSKAQKMRRAEARILKKVANLTFI